MNYTLCIIYDGIANSVFHSQVLMPFLKKIPKGQRGLLISFERSQPHADLLASITRHKNIDLIILKKLPFIGSLSLRYAAYQLNNALSTYSIISTIARGPLAGWIAGHTKQLRTTKITIQARGLAAAEYEYTHKQESWFHRFRAWQYRSIERWTFGAFAPNALVTISCVSDTLKAYLVEHFQCPPAKIAVATDDIPKMITPARVASWRSELRASLGIAQDTYVYVYNGSAKPWQCPDETVSFFKRIYKRNEQTFLLILSQDTQQFLDLIEEVDLPENAYKVLNVAYEQVYHYLAAADAGIIFRESHPINWVSRPTKVLEYQAVGLKIIHNNTIGALCGIEQ